MRLVIVYKPHSEHASATEGYMRDFARQTGHDIETLDPETRDGEGFARTYDVVEYPTMIALDEDSRVHSVWRGVMPTISEASYYVQ